MQIQSKNICHPIQRKSLSNFTKADSIYYIAPPYGLSSIFVLSIHTNFFINIIESTKNTLLPCIYTAPDATVRPITLAAPARRSSWAAVSIVVPVV